MSGFPKVSNVIDQSEYEKRKRSGLTGVQRCQKCGSSKKGLLYIDGNGLIVCEECKGSQFDWKK